MNKKINRLHPLSFASLLGAVIFPAITTSALAESYYGDSSYYSDSARSKNSILQPKVRWYRYYDSNGQPHLSNSITTEQMRFGYEALDRNMQVVKKVEPYSAEQYAMQKAQRDAAMAKRNADLDLKKAYVSSVAAAAKRDQILADMTSRRSYLMTQLAGLQSTLSKNIADAADYERQQKPIPLALQKNLAESRKNVDEAQQNVAAIDARQQQVRAEYEVIIRRLSAMEHGD